MRMIFSLSIVFILFFSGTNPKGTTIRDRFRPPAGYLSDSAKTGSFAGYLVHLPLKKEGSKVLYYDGTSKDKLNVYCGVVNLPIGHKDLHQCADAVMRLRGEYLFQNKQFSDIHFNFLSDGKPRYFQTFAKGKTDYPAFWKYMEYVFQYANTASLKRELKKVDDIRQIQIGDVFITTGSPYGHAEIVVDKASDPKTGKSIFLLAQSYMPAQEIQILNNPSNANLSPWYEVNEQAILTPEWEFQTGDLYRFKEK